jgi:hypothetical protein
MAEPDVAAGKIDEPAPVEFSRVPCGGEDEPEGWEGGMVAPEEV